MRTNYKKQNETTMEDLVWHIPNASLESMGNNLWALCLMDGDCIDKKLSHNLTPKEMSLFLDGFTSALLKDSGNFKAYNLTDPRA